jgi:ferredoxin-like protein FixX
MVKRKRKRTNNDPKQTIQWSNEKEKGQTKNKNKQYKDQKKKSFVFFICPLYCLLWVIVCPLSFSFDHCIVCYGSLFVLQQ